MAELTFGTTAGGDVRKAKELEALGYVSLWTGGHLIYPIPMQESLIQLAVLATHTEKARIGTNVLVLPLYHPTVVAKQIATIDWLSGGRAVLGVGVGGEYRKEYESVGVPVNERGARANEGIEVLRKLWSGEKVSNEGRFYPFKDIQMSPPPVQRPAIPIWVGGKSEAAARRAGRQGDGYVPNMGSIQEYPQRLAIVEEEARRHGRDPNAIERSILLYGCLGEKSDEVKAATTTRMETMWRRSFTGVIDDYVLCGDAAACRDGIERWAEAGVRHFVVAPMPYQEGETNLQGRWMRDVLAPFK